MVKEVYIDNSKENLLQKDTQDLIDKQESKSTTTIKSDNKSIKKFVSLEKLSKALKRIKNGSRKNKV